VSDEYHAPVSLPPTKGTAVRTGQDAE